jgi:type III pantothenate kinase
VIGDRIIAVDVGNSAIKLGWEQEKESGAELVTTPFALAQPGWESTVLRFVEEQFGAPDLPDPVLWYAASVNAPACERLRNAVSAQRPRDQWLEMDRADIDLPLAIRNPDSLGIDRLLGAAAADAWAGGQPVISIDAGSAVTVDLVYDGQFRGGAILPGIQLQFKVLCQATDRLPEVQIAPGHDLEIPGRDTVAAIRSGVLLGIAGAIDRHIDHYGQIVTDLKLPIPLVVLTGGDAPLLQPLLRHQVHVRRSLLATAILKFAKRARID